jgi:RecA-family ATPase
VVYLSAEDGLTDTLRPRLDKAGTDLNRIYALTGTEEIDETGKLKSGNVSLKDLDVIEAALQQIKPALVVVDPLQAYLGAKVDIYRANEVRPILVGLAALTEKYKCAVLYIRHLGKSQQDRVVYRGLGSIGFSATASKRGY